MQKCEGKNVLISNVAVAVYVFKVDNKETKWKTPRVFERIIIF